VVQQLQLRIRRKAGLIERSGMGTSETEKIVGEFEEMSTTNIDDYY
jgi:hypothetical protein